MREEDLNQSLDEVKKFFQDHQTFLLIGTADRSGLPHLAMEMEVQWIKERTIRFESWFCLATIRNLSENPRVAVAVIDQKTHKGYQLLGQIESIHETAILDGYVAGEIPGEQIFPAQAYRIDIAIDRVLHFSPGPCSAPFGHDDLSP